MFQRILVPLDGSDRAEQAIVTAVNLAHASGGSIVLLQVINPDIAHLESPGISMETLDAEIERAKQYLAMIAASNILSDISVTTEVLTGDPALTIFPAAHAQQADLIVMCSHGSTGVRRWGIGSVSQKVARCCPLPVLILREGAGVPTNLHPGGVRSVRVQVALDGSPLAEAALLPAAQLSATLSAPAAGTLHLVHVVPHATQDGQAVHESAQKEAESYLQTIQQRLLTEDAVDLKLHITTLVATNTDIADALIGMAEDSEGMEAVEDFEGCDCIAMATHGRGGLQRWLMGSITERVLHATKLPLLIIRPQKVTASDKPVEAPEEEALTSWVGLL
ncbi:MAG TPA: universal stress protein [Ktedonobacteraceae bacterium]|nr:universal stress protein [Ktedonobacteraceae bacterium]